MLRLLRSGSLDQAVDLVSRAKDVDYAIWPNGSGMKYIRARLEEEDEFGGVGADEALRAFSELSLESGEFQSEGMIGRARMLYRMTGESSLEEVIALYKMAVDLDKNTTAMTCLGWIYERNKSDLKVARSWYLRAYRNGSPWGLRLYARLQAGQHNYVMSSLAHVVTTLTSPIQILFRGVRTPFK